MIDEQKTKPCPFCGGEIYENAQKCKHCGKWLNEQKQVCPYCMKEIPLKAKKCSFCGSSVKRKKSQLVKFANILLNFLIIFTCVIVELASNGGGAGFALVFILLIANAIYLLPTYIADGKMHKQTNFIFLVNFLLGFTFIGWIAALIWALSDDE